MPFNKQIRIALVDDHPLFLKGFSKLIESVGYTVFMQCLNGKELISKLDPNELPGLIFMDVNMPEMDGYETTRWVKERYPSIPILALSIDNNPDVINRMMECGANGYILKFAELYEMKLAIETVIKKGAFSQQIDKGTQSWLTGKPYFKP